MLGEGIQVSLAQPNDDFLNHITSEIEFLNAKISFRNVEYLYDS